MGITGGISNAITAARQNELSIVAVYEHWKPCCEFPIYHHHEIVKCGNVALAELGSL